MKIWDSVYIYYSWVTVTQIYIENYKYTRFGCTFKLFWFLFVLQTKNIIVHRHRQWISGSFWQNKNNFGITKLDCNLDLLFLAAVFVVPANLVCLFVSLQWYVNNKFLEINKNTRASFHAHLINIGSFTKTLFIMSLKFINTNKSS